MSPVAVVNNVFCVKRKKKRKKKKESLHAPGLEVEGIMDENREEV